MDSIANKIQERSSTTKEKTSLVEGSRFSECIEVEVYSTSVYCDCYQLYAAFSHIALLGARTW